MPKAKLTFHPLAPDRWKVVETLFGSQGVATRLVRASVQHVREQGGRMVEGYPVGAKSRQPDAWICTGPLAAFERAGFKEVARRSKTRPIMRRRLKRG